MGGVSVDVAVDALFHLVLAAQFRKAGDFFGIVQGRVVEGGNEMHRSGCPGTGQGALQPLDFPVVDQLVVFPELGHGGQVPAPGAADGHVPLLVKGIVEKMDFLRYGLLHFAQGRPPIIVVSL